MIHGEPITVEVVTSAFERYRQIKDILDQGVKELAREFYKHIQESYYPDYVVYNAKWYYKYGNSIVVLLGDNKLPPVKEHRAIIVPIEVFITRNYEPFVEWHTKKYFR